ncbi:hypothetical protein ACJMK2_009870 [Sinanodonta woodiana]|uniref:THD domain-containing protein n=1 Tax=Sinanodonta woodiana TaxID=1069815 RepID=A0ABD3VGK1_SINWO
MNVTDIRRQESETDVFDVEKNDGKKDEMKRRNFCLYIIMVQTVVTVITVGLVMIIDRKLILHRSPPLNDLSPTETSAKMPKYMALEDTKREIRAAHLYYNDSKTRSGQHCCVMWADPPFLNSFVSEGITFHTTNGSLQVKESGIYQIYSKLTLKYNRRKLTDNQSNLVSYSTLQINGKTVSIEHFNFPLPGNVSMYHVLHFGIYHLDAGDTLWVTMHNDTILYLWDWDKASFFGLNLIGRI